MNYPFTASEESISLFFNGKMHSIPSTNSSFKELAEHLKKPEHDYETIEALIDQPTKLARLTEGKVTVVGRSVYFEGTPIHSTLAAKLVTLLEAGFDAKPWARFMDRVMRNPSQRSRECLYDFLANWDAPIDADGFFIAFKNVRSDYKDIYSGTFDNSPGCNVSMPREKVNDNPDARCSSGLHVAASSYLNHYINAGDKRTIAVRVDPADVVAVPRDYGFAKMRVCAYTVLGDAEESFINNAHSAAFHDTGSYRAKAEGSTKADGASEVCDDCGTNRVKAEGDVCTDCEAEDLQQWQERVDADSDAIDEANHIAETGLTRSGEVPGESSAYSAYYGAGHNVDRFADKTGEDSSGDDEPSEMSFTRSGTTYLESQIIAGVKKHGQRGYSRLTGIPRTTIQDWINRIG